MQSAVYVVDDDPELCESVRWLLASVGIEVTAFNLADDFLAAYDGSHPACLILDVRMPRMSGPRLQEVLAEIAPHVQIIFVSAHGDVRLSVKTMRQGALSFLEKPYDSQDLLDTIEAGLALAREVYDQHHNRQVVQERVASLTPREREILGLVVEGLPSQNIARKLGTSVKTVDVHRARIRSKTHAESINTLVRDILRFGVTID